MSFTYPNKPWQDGQEIKANIGGREVVVAKYDASKNLWTHLRINEAGVHTYVSSCDVILSHDCSDPCLPNIDWDNIDNLQVALDYLYYWLFDPENGAIPRLDKLEGRVDDLEDVYNQLLQLINNLGGLQDLENLLNALAQIAETLENHEERIKDLEDNWRDRAPIVQSSPPTNHPDFGADPLKIGDFWIDDNKIMHYWTGSEWEEVLDSLSYADDRYVKKAGDTMTGELVMDNAGEIEMINTDFELRRTMPNDGTGNWDPNRSRFGIIRSRVPRIIEDDGTETAATGPAFGIEIDLADLNTYRNELKVTSKDNDILRITSGANPTITINDQIDRSNMPDNKGIESGVEVRGISTPDRERTPGDFAVNKEYVDQEDAILLNGIIDLQEEIDAIAPSLEKGAWEWDPNTDVTQAPETGKYFLLSGVSPTWTITDEYDQADAVVFHNTDANGVVHSNWDAVVADKLILLFDKPDPDKCLGVVTEVLDVFPGSTTITFDRTEGFGNPNNNLDENNKYITFVNIFSAPSGGTASEFVLKRGDTMTGELEFYKEQADNAINYSIPAANTKDIRFTTKRLDDGSTNQVSLYQPGYGSYVVSSGNLMARGSLYTSSYLYATTFNSDGSRTTKNPRIYFYRDTSNEYGSLRWSSSDRVNWNSTGGQIKHGSNVLLEWTSAGITKLLGNSGQGTNGQVLKLNSSLKPYWANGATNYVRTNTAGFNANMTITKTSGVYYITGG